MGYGFGGRSGARQRQPSAAIPAWPPWGVLDGHGPALALTAGAACAAHAILMLRSPRLRYRRCWSMAAGRTAAAYGLQQQSTEAGIDFDPVAAAISCVAAYAPRIK